MCCPFFSVVNYSLYSHGRFCAYSIMIVSSLVAYGNTFLYYICTLRRWCSAHYKRNRRRRGGAKYTIDFSPWYDDQQAPFVGGNGGVKRREAIIVSLCSSKLDQYYSRANWQSTWIDVLLTQVLLSLREWPTDSLFGQVKWKIERENAYLATITKSISLLDGRKHRFDTCG